MSSAAVSELDRGPSSAAPPPGGGPRRRRASLGTLGTGAALFAGQASTGLAFLVLARRTSPGSFGAFVALYAVSNSVGGLIDFGSSSRMSLDLAQGADPRQLMSWLGRRAVRQVPGVVLFAALALRFADHRLPVVCVIALSSQALTVVVAHGSLFAVRSIKSPVLSEWLVFFGNLATLVAAAVAPSRYLLSSVAIAAALSWVICTAAALWSIRSQILPRLTGLRGNPWTGAVSFGFASLAVIVQGFLLLIVERTAGAEQAGELGAIQKWTQPIGLVALAYSGFLFPSMASAVADRVAIRLMKSIVVVFAFGAAVAAFIVAFAPKLISVLLGPEYSHSVHILRLLIIVSLPELVVQPLSVLLQSRGMQRRVAWTTMALSVGGLVGVAALSPHFGNTAVGGVEAASNAIAFTVFVITVRHMWIRNAVLVPAAGVAEPVPLPPPTGQRVHAAPPPPPVIVAVQPEALPDAPHDRAAREPDVAVAVPLSTAEGLEPSETWQERLDVFASRIMSGSIARVEKSREDSLSFRMPRSWPILATIAVISVVAGVTIAGRPESADSFVLAPDQVPTTTELAADSTLTTDATSGSAPVVQVTTTTNTTASGSASKATVRIVLVDASGSDAIAGAAKSALTTAGYTQVVSAASTATAPVTATTIFYRVGFSAQAATLAKDLGIADASQIVLTDQVLSAEDTQGDLVVQLGPDAPA